MSKVDKVLAEVLSLEPTEKIELIDKVLASFHPVNKGVEILWNDEAEERISTYKNTSLPSIDEETIFSKYKK